MKHVPAIAFLVLTCSAAGVRAQDTSVPASSTSEPCFIGTSLFTLMNLAPDDQPPHFYQVNIGYKLTPKDRLSVEAITWRYYHPLGIPWGESRESADKAYPGHVREFGVGRVPAVADEGLLLVDQRGPVLSPVLRHTE